MSGRKRKKTCAKNKWKNQLKVKNQVTNAGAGEETPANISTFSDELLPPELWEIIFKNVESPKDLLSCWNTTCGWRKGLQSTDFYFRMTLPFILPYLSSNDLLECSSVSKFWNATVDMCMQTAQDFEADCELNDKQRIHFCLDSDQLTDFIDTAMCTNNESGETLMAINPVVFRRVTLDFSFRIQAQYDDDDDDDDDVPIIVNWDNLLKCFDHHGHLIHHFHLAITDYEGNVTFGDIIGFIDDCLKRTPNLRVFIISMKYKSDAEVEYYGGIRLYNFRATLPWPALKHLKVLKLSSSDHHHHHDVFCHIANGYAHQVVNLHFCCDLIEVLRLVPRRFSCLKKINLLFLNIWNVYYFDAVLKNCKRSLKHLIMEFLTDDPNIYNATGLAVAVNTVSATLEILTVVNRTEQNFDITKFDLLRLPRLKELQLGSFGYPSLEFLTTVCPALERLNVRPDTSDHYKVLKAGDLYYDLYLEHQFWNELAHIKTVDVSLVSKLSNGFFKQFLIRGKIQREIIQKHYTRVGYIAQLEVNRAIGDAQTDTESSSENEKANSQQQGSDGSPDVLMTRSKQVYKRY